MSDREFLAAPESETILTSSLADEIAFRLQRKILEGEYPPGKHLVQDELCQLFGVSRTPVREALRKLQAQHLVVVVPNRGAKVRGLSRKELTEVFTVRAELEGFACELAAPKLTPGRLRELARVQGSLEEVVREFERNQIGPKEEPAFNARLNRANDDFHSLIHETAQNAHLSRLIDNLHSFFPRDYIWQAGRSARQEFLELNIGDHKLILRALRERNGKQARKAMREHVRHAGVLLLGFLETKGRS